jgi:hypothetical protein
MIEKDYRAWIRTGSPLEAARDPQLWQYARRAEQAWHEVRRRGVADGPAAAATRYGELADAAERLADGFTITLPSSALPSLLELAEHARKHSMRLNATALAMAGTRSGHSTEDQRLADTDRSPGNAAHDALPDHLAALTRNAYASKHRQPQRSANANDDHAAIRNASTRQQNQQQDRSRGLALCRGTPLWRAIRICPVTRHELDAMAITVSARILHTEPDFWVFELPDGRHVEVFGDSYPGKEHFSTGPVAGFAVRDLPTAVEELRKAGIELLGEHGPTWQHFRGPVARFPTESPRTKRHSPAHGGTAPTVASLLLTGLYAQAAQG